MRKLSILLLLAGCATTFSHPTKTQADLERDWYECNKVGEQRAANKGMPGNIFVEVDYANECMVMEKGWTKR